MNHLKAVVTFEDRETTLVFHHLVAFFSCGQNMLNQYEGSIRDMSHDLKATREGMVLLMRVAPFFVQAINIHGPRHFFPEFFSNPAVTTPEHWEKENKNE